MNILIVGSGQVGYFLCERFSREGHEVTLVDHDQAAVERAQDRLNVLGVVGNALDGRRHTEGVLLKGGKVPLNE